MDDGQRTRLGKYARGAWRGRRDTGDPDPHGVCWPAGQRTAALHPLLAPPAPGRDPRSMRCAAGGAGIAETGAV